MGVGFILVAIASEIVSHHHGKTVDFDAGAMRLIRLTPGFRIPLDDSERSSAIQAFKVQLSQFGSTRAGH